MMRAARPHDRRRWNPLPAAARGLVGAATIAAGAWLSAAVPAAESRPIFDGVSLSGWEGDASCWRVEDGAITAQIPAGETLAGNRFLWWEGEVADFELDLDYRISGVPSANSGIQFRSRRLPDGHAAGYQADLDDGATWLGRIYDEHGRGLLVERGTRLAIAPDGRTWAEAFADPAAVRGVVRPGAWNRYRIRATAAHVTLWINDTLAAVLDDRDAARAAFSGRLALQLHSGVGPVKLQFRDLRLTDLGATRPVAGPPAAAPPAGVTPGRDWTSPVLWHTVANPPDPMATVPAADAPDAAARSVVAGMRVTPGFRVDLVAAEPLVRQPIAFAIDPRGRLWILEAFAYPNRRPAGAGRDRIVILADADGDGRFESRRVFHEGLNLASGLELGFGGVFVGAAPHLLFIPDRDGDDVPDGEPEILLDGWGLQDTHETLNSFTWGPDGWLYGCHGVFTSSRVGRPGTSDADRQPIKAGIWRYHPVRRAFEVFAHGGSNQWGIDFTSTGDAVMTHCRSFHGGGGTTLVIRNGLYWNQANAGYPPFICREPPGFAPGLRNFLPAAARYDGGAGGAGKPGSDAVYGGHSHVGTMVYRGDNWPAIYRDRIFTHNLHGRQLNHQEIVPQGSGCEVFPAGHDILHVPDPTYVAVDLQYGPDGAVYAIDWCDLQHCHSTNDEQWDRSTGRVYRIAWAETFRPRPVDLAARSDAELVALHGHANEWFVRTARRLLHERAAAGTLDRAALAPLHGRAAAADAVTALRSLWTLHVTGELDDAALAAAFAHADDRVRVQAVALATEAAGTPRLPVAVLHAAAAGDPAPLVRRGLASALPMLPEPDRWRIAEALAARPEDAADRFLPKLTWTGLAPLVAGDPARALAIAAATPQPDLADSIRWYLGRLPEGRDVLVREIATADAATAERTLRLLDFALESEAGAPAAPAGWEAAVARFRSGPAAPVADRIAAVWGDEPVRARLRSLLADARTPVAARRDAFVTLRRTADAAAAPVFVALLDDPAFRTEAIPLASRSGDPAIAAKLLGLLPELDDKGRGAALSALVAKPAFATPLLDAIAAGSLVKDDLTAVHVRQLRGLRDTAVAARVEAIYGRLNESPAAARATMARLKKAYAEAPSWAVDRERGRMIFARACASCHLHGDSGGRLGPPLTGSWTNGPDYFIENLVDPNAVVGPDYQMTVVLSDDGRSFNGIVAEETPETLSLQTVDGMVAIPRAMIEERTTSPVSMMPAGLLEALPEADMLALVKFLTTKP